MIIKNNIIIINNYFTLQDTIQLTITFVNNIKALSEVRLSCKNSTQRFSKAGTSYFLATYKVAITVSGPI